MYEVVLVVNFGLQINKVRELIQKTNESVEFVQRGGRGQTPNSYFLVFILVVLKYKSWDGLGRLIPIFGSKL